MSKASRQYSEPLLEKWRSEYLNELRESHRYSAKKTPAHSSVSRGDVVIVHDDTLPRGLWKLGSFHWM